MPLFQVKSHGLTDVGLIRENNEDVWGAVISKNFFVLADGMGGHKAGEVAASETVSKLTQLIERSLGGNPTLSEAQKLIEESIHQVNHEVYQKSCSDEELRGMGTTLCCLYFHEEGVVFAHVGDSRIYRLRKKRLKQLTQDHSLVTEMIELGEISERKAEKVGYKNIITRAVGAEPKVKPVVSIIDIAHEDRFLMCSDGLTDLLTKQQIEKYMSYLSDPKEIVEGLVDSALSKGGHDNVTVVVMHVEK